jgi:hypothetical protein
MLGTWFYHKRVRTAVSVFGSLFNNIYVLRENSSGEIFSQVKVPLSYAPKSNFIQRLAEMVNGEEAERRVAVKLPRMSFEITSMSYDAQRQLPKVNNFVKTLDTTVLQRRKFYTAVPYDIDFQLNIYAKSQDDALQIVEQILPYFNPQYSVTVKPFSDYTDILEDVPIVLNGVSFQDDYEGPLEQRRTIIYTLDFRMKVSFYGPQQDRAIIRQVNNNIFNLGAGLLDSDVLLNNIEITPTPTGVSPDSDYGFNITYLDSAAP